MSLTPELSDLRDRILGVARGYGLDPFETIFEVVDYDRINELAAFGGFPTRYPHWRFGMEYEQLAKSAEYGLSKIYEMVINTDPSYAYLLEGNRLVDQKTVMAHVYGHVDFFKHNYYFSKTNRRMVDEMANHATRVRRLVDRLGIDVVEAFIDTCLSLDNLIDIHAPFIARPAAREPAREAGADPARLHAERAYMEEFINPPELVARAREEQARRDEQRRSRFPENPQRDILGFLAEHAPLETWQRDILEIIREEAYYFAPQGMTKIMNEGWASYWHSHILTHGVLDDSEIIDFADAHSGVTAMSPGRLNPYKLGIELWRDIEHRWDRGMFGAEYETCQSLAERERWNKDLGLGRQKLFEVRRLHNDVTFLDEFLTQDFVERQRLYTFGYNPKARRWEISSREFEDVKRQLLDQLTNFGHPHIVVRDANFRNRGELLLRHRFLGQPLREDTARDTLTNLATVWKRPVYIETIVEDRPRLRGYDGTTHSDEPWDLDPREDA
ncbi:MAG: SpoVR family protein [Myxococcales bacterium]|nr:SpoVR family protein [Myxococcales bacterium]MCB9533770.1 SpoVR family protein [Myxococcales bacterium]